VAVVDCLAQRPRHVADAVYEGLHHRADRSVLQRNDRDLEEPSDKINRQYFERELVDIESQDGTRQ
jgi:hypothetical protein